jgi:SLT domain-containing protein
MNYIEETLELKAAPMRHHLAGLSYTATGYGAKIPSPAKALYNGRLYRVYLSIFGNAGTSYILIKNIKHILRQH